MMVLALNSILQGAVYRPILIKTSAKHSKLTLELWFPFC